MLDAVLAFFPVAAMLALSPGPATALVIHSAARGGRRPALVVMAGDAAGLAIWAVASMFGVSALVAASATAYTVLKVFGAGVLLWFGILLAAEQILLAMLWYLLLASLVSRARAAFVRGARKLEAISGAALIAFGIKLASDAR